MKKRNLVAAFVPALIVAAPAMASSSRGSRLRGNLTGIYERTTNEASSAPGEERRDPFAAFGGGASAQKPTTEPNARVTEFLQQQGLLSTTAERRSVEAGVRKTFASSCQIGSLVSNCQVTTLQSVCSMQGGVWFPNSDNCSAGSLNAPPMPSPANTTDVSSSNAGETSYSFDIAFFDGDGNFDASTIDANDVTVTGPGGAVTVSNASFVGDVTGGVVTYTITPPGGSWDAADNGTYTISLAGSQVGDTAPEYTPAFPGIGSFSVSIVSNTAPSITSTAVTAVDEDSAYSYTFAASDTDANDTLTYSAPTLPSWLSFNTSTGVLSGTPTNSEVGNHNVTLRVNDGTVDVDQSFTIAVANTNDAPVVSSAAVTSVAEDSAYSYTFAATDVDTSDTLTYSAPTLPSWLSFNTTTGVLSGTPTNDEVGGHNVVLRVNDGTVNVDQSFTITVANTNDAPVLSSPLVTTVNEDSPFSYTLLAFDADMGDTLTYSAPTLPSWLGFDTNTHVLSGTPTNDEVGSHNVTLRVNDGTVDVDQSFTITVVNTNDAPVVTGTPVTRAVEGVAYSFTINAGDVDVSDTLTYVIANNPSWLSIDSGTGVVSGTPSSSDVGTATGVLVGANDNTVTVNLSAFDITVVGDLDGDGQGDDVDTDIDGDGMDNAYETANGLNPRDASDASGDLDGDGVSNLDEYTAQTDPQADDYAPVVTAPDDVTVDSTGIFTQVDYGTATAVDGLDGVLVPTSDGATHLAPGVHTITWSATDAAGNTGSDTQVVNVIPMVSFSKDQTSGEGATVTVKVTLNGKVVSYPVTVPYTVGGTAMPSTDHGLVDGSVTITSGIEGSFSFTVVDDGVGGEPAETVEITMGTPVNAVKGAKTVHTVTLTEANEAPTVALQAYQGGGPTQVVAQDAGQVVVTSIVADPNPGDNHTYDWSASDNALVDTDGNSTNASFTIDPSNMTAGLYKLSLTVNDGQATGKDELILNIVSAPPTLSATDDSDGDGTDDQAEGHGDDDGDGVPDYLDAISARNVLQEQRGVSSQFVIEAEPGISLNLGQTAFQAGNGRADVSGDDITQQTGQSDDEDYSYPGGRFDFNVEELPVAGQSVSIVVAQFSPIPADAVYRKLMPSGWQDFVIDADNAVASAQGTEGFCPPPGDVSYTSGLTQGHWCVQLTIEDGGPNDADGEVNQAIDDPGGVAQKKATSSSGGGGAFSPLWLLILLILGYGMALVRREEKKE